MRVDVFDFFFEAVLLKDYHLVFEDIAIVLFQQPFVSEVDAKLFERVVSEVFKAENIEQID
jgi:hypothetical protein